MIMIDGEEYIKKNTIAPTVDDVFPIGQHFRLETCTYAMEGIVEWVNDDFVKLNPAVRNTDMVRFSEHIKGIIDTSKTENEALQFGGLVNKCAITNAFQISEREYGTI